jgi:hypothetical protein
MKCRFPGALELSLTKYRRKSRIIVTKRSMGFTKDMAADRAKYDLAKRLGISGSEIKIEKIVDRDFPDMSLGAPVNGEMSAQMISSGWQIVLEADKKDYEYRADKYQLRLYHFKGQNYVIES